MLTLWIIDDTPALLHGLELAFEADFQVMTFSAPGDCLRAFREGKGERPDILLVDNEMPGMTGVEMIRQVQNTIKGAPSPRPSPLEGEGEIGKAFSLEGEGGIGKADCFVADAPRNDVFSGISGRGEKRVKIILMSFSITFDMVIESWHLGVTEWLEKPFDLFELQGILEREKQKL